MLVVVIAHKPVLRPQTAEEALTRLCDDLSALNNAAHAPSSFAGVANASVMLCQSGSARLCATRWLPPRHSAVHAAAAAADWAVCHFCSLMGGGQPQEDMQLAEPAPDLF